MNFHHHVCFLLHRVLVDLLLLADLVALRDIKAYIYNRSSKIQPTNARLKRPYLSKQPGLELRHAALKLPDDPLMIGEQAMQFHPLTAIFLL